jgi:hypothetical protein
VAVLLYAVGLITKRRRIARERHVRRMEAEAEGHRSMAEGHRQKAEELRDAADAEEQRATRHEDRAGEVQPQ